MLFEIPEFALTFRTSEDEKRFATVDHALGRVEADDSIVVDDVN